MGINELQKQTNTNIQEKATLIWEIATHLVGLYKPHEYGKVILPMTVLKRFDDALAPTKAAVVELAQKLNDENVSFSDMAKKELSILATAVNEILNITVNAFANNDNEAAKSIEPLEEVIDDMVMMLRDRHTKRLKNGACSVGSGLVFMEMLTYMERASDQCSSIAVSMLARNNEAILQNHYDYLREIHSGNDQAYKAEKDRRREQYISPLKEIKA
jgi:phosphate:Na+ symporter